MNDLLVDIVFENEDFAILNKKRGEPTAPLKEGDSSLLTHFLSLGHVKEKVIGKKVVEAGLLHRLDTATAGLVLIAKTQKMFDILQDMQERCLIEKEYLAVCDLVPSQMIYFPKKIKKTNNFYSFNIISSFSPYGRKGYKVKMIDIRNNNFRKSNFTQKIKQYETKVFVEDEAIQQVLDNLFRFKKTSESNEMRKIQCTCRLYQGYRHQVRVHLSSIGLPIRGDALYNTHYIKEMGTNIEEKIANTSYPLHLYATRLTFPSPYKHAINRNSSNKSFKDILSFSLPQLNKMSL